MLEAMQWEAVDAGSTNKNELGKTMHNQCFYLSLARSYLPDQARDVVEESALCFKRIIEACALAAHPEWAEHGVRENSEAFSDFVVYALGEDPFLKEFSVAVLDTATSSAQVFMGRDVPGPDRQAEQRALFLTVLHFPGHFKAALPRPSMARLTPSVMFQRLDKLGVAHVTTYC